MFRTVVKEVFSKLLWASGKEVRYLHIEEPKHMLFILLLNEALKSTNGLLI